MVCNGLRKTSMRHSMVFWRRKRALSWLFTHKFY